MLLNMHSKRAPHVPVGIITYNGSLILAAAQKHPEIAPRLPGDFLTATEALGKKITADVTGQKSARGELGNLTAGQTRDLHTLKYWMNKARQTAALAFPGQTVKLHQEFQIGSGQPVDLPSILTRADIIIASVQNTANFAALKLQGWTDAETKALTDMRSHFGPAEVVKQTAKGGAKDATGQKNIDAADYYQRLLTIQNAADLQWPATDSANAGVRDDFRLSTFPPSHDRIAPPPTPAPAAATAAK